MLYYCPLEGYKERYTMQWSAPITGWLERNWIKVGVEYKRIDGIERIKNRPKQIKDGVVLDAVTRSMYCFAQVEQLLALAEFGSITSDDVIYFDDFWHPGIEALAYAFHIFGIKPKMYAFLHAQSVDEFDFTYSMRRWMRPFEQGIAAILNGIFVCGSFLQGLVIEGGIAAEIKVHVTGHPFSSEEVRERFPKVLPKKENRIVFSSRWDDEKNPKFFLKVAKEVITRAKMDVKFIICTGSEHIRSNNPRNIQALEQAMKEFPYHIILKENLSKEEYYYELLRAKIQMNTANQDFVAITLLESSVAGCYPVYPNFRSFPETLRHSKDGIFMYKHLSLESAVRHVLYIIKRNDLWGPANIQKRAWVHERFDTSWARQLNIMRVPPQQEVDMNPYACEED